jgi:phage terminase small subunit
MTPRRARFVEEYCRDFDAAHAAIRAGFARRSAAAYGWYLLRQADVAAAVERRMDVHAQSCAAMADRVIAELAAIAFSDIRNYVSWSARQLRVKPRSRIAPEHRPALAAIGPGRVTLRRKTEALKALARHVGLTATREFADPLVEREAAALVRAQLLAAAGLPPEAPAR